GRPTRGRGSWEDFAGAAAFFADRDKRPSLPRFTADRGRLVDLFSRVASCYDRPALTDTTAERKGEAADRTQSLAFQFRLADGKPRIESAGFQAAARWLDGLNERKCLPSDGPADPARALAEDRAVLA